MSQKQKSQASPLPSVTQSGEQPARKASQAAILGILTGERARKQASEGAGADDKRCDAEWALGVEWTLRMMS